MKTLLTIILWFITITPVPAQPGIYGGVNVSSFTAAESPWGTWGNKIASPTAGLYDVFNIDKNIFIQAELAYIQTGAYNPVEHTSFRVNNIAVPVTLGIRIHQIDVQAGVYIMQMVHANNHNFSGVSTFDWRTGDWDYYKQRNGGFVGSVGYDLIGARIQARAMRSYYRVQDKDYGDHKDLGYDLITNIALYIPFKTFRE